MTEKPQAVDPADDGSTPGGSAPADGGGAAAAPPAAAAGADPQRADAGAQGDDGQAVDAPAPDAGGDEPEPDGAAGENADDQERSPVLDEMVDEPEVEVEVGEAKVRVPRVDQPAGTDGPVVDEPAKPVEEDAADAAGPLAAQLESVRADLDERTRDLQRVTAEYANYRKRVDRDKSLVTEQATGAVLLALLPVLDDIDRAREHGDLVGPFATVAEQLTGAVGKLGLTAFGEKGDPFDPNRHEAVAHSTSADVTESTCVEVMRRGYLLNDRLLRPALVAVADPQ